MQLRAVSTGSNALTVLCVLSAALVWALLGPLLFSPPHGAVFSVTTILVGVLLGGWLRRPRSFAGPASRAVSEKQAELEATWQIISDAVVVTDRAGVVRSLNTVAEQLTGWTAAQAVGRPLDEVFVISDEPTGEPLESPVEKVLRTGAAVGRTDHTILTSRTGSRLRIDHSAVPIRKVPIASEPGEPSGVVIAFRDASERRRVEEQMWERQRELQIVTDNAPVYIARLDLDRRFKFVNRPYASQFGLHPRDIIGKTIADVLGDEAARVLDPYIVTVAAGQRVSFETEVPYRDLGVQHMHGVYEPELDSNGCVCGFVCAVTNITERKKVEKALRETQTLFDAVINNSPACIFAKDRSGKYLLANDSLAKLVGRRAEEFRGRTDYDFFPAAVADEFAKDDRSIIAAGESRTYEESFEHDGTLRTYLTVKFPLRDPSGNPYAACAVATDITDTKRAEEELRTSAERLSLALSAAQLGDWQWDAATDIVTMSPRAAEIFGIPSGPAMTWTEMQLLLDPEDRARAGEAVERSLAERDQYDVEYRVHRPDGSTVWVTALGRGYYAPSGDPLGMYGIVRDITERKKAEELVRDEARINETLSRLGRLVAAELDLHKVVQIVTDETTSLAGAKFGAFFYNVFSERGEAYTLYTLSGVSRESFARFPMPRNTAIFEPTFRGAGIVRIDDVTKDPRYGKNAPYHGMPDGHLPVSSYLAVPVISRSGAVLGGLFFGHPDPGVFTERHERLIVGIAAHAAAAIDNAQLYGQVQESEQRFRQLADNVQEVFWITDPSKNRLLYVNPAYERIWGRTAESLYADAASFLDGIHTDDRPRVLAESIQAQHRGVPSDIEYRVVRPDGTIRWVRDRGFPVKDASGAVFRTVGVAADITERKRSEETSRFLADASAALASLVDFDSTLQRVARLAVPFFSDWCAVDVVDPDGAVREVAIAHSDPSRIPLGQALGRKLAALGALGSSARRVMHSGEAELVHELTDEILTSRFVSAEIVDDVRRLGFRSYMAVPLKVRGKVLAVLTFVSAESGRLYDHQDLSVAEDLVHRAAVAMENAQLYETLRENDRRKDEFLALLGHELRNPLAPISNALQVLKLPGADTVITQRAREMMERQVEHLVRLVDDLLDVSRIMRGKVDLRLEAIDVATVIARAVETAQVAIDSEGHRLELAVAEEPLVVNGDMVRLAQVVSNLLQNAAKYTERGGLITVKAERVGDDAVISVKDTGIGIAPDQLTRVFDMFFQAERRTKNAQGGLGIGLSLVRGLVQLHHGSVEARSEGPGRGSELLVRLPLLQRAAGGRPKKHAPDLDGQSGERQRVLVVDDNSDAADSLAMLLRLEGHEVHVAYDALTAFAAAESRKPHVAFLDLGMPMIDGFELARRIRSHPSLCEMTLIAVTGWGQAEDRQRTHDAGFDLHLVKPVDLSALRLVLSGGALDAPG